MAVHLYLSTIPEALIASMLTPMDFGAYYAVGTEKKSRGQAQFFSVDRGFSSDYFPLGEIDSRCVPHANGEPETLGVPLRLPRAGACSALGHREPLPRHA